MVDIFILSIEGMPMIKLQEQKLKTCVSSTIKCILGLVNSFIFVSAPINTEQNSSRSTRDTSNEIHPQGITDNTSWWLNPWSVKVCHGPGCTNTKNLQACAGCKAYWYRANVIVIAHSICSWIVFIEAKQNLVRHCSPACQKRHWKAGHKKECKTNHRWWRSTNSDYRNGYHYNYGAEGGIEIRTMRSVRDDFKKTRVKIEIFIFLQKMLKRNPELSLARKDSQTERPTRS